MDCAHPYALAHGALEGTGLGFWQNRSRVVASFTFAIVAFASSPFNSAVPLYRFFFLGLLLATIVFILSWSRLSNDHSVDSQCV